MSKAARSRRSFSCCCFDTLVSALLELLGRNLFVTILDDHVGFKLMRDYPYLADASLWSSDYPHSVTLWPKSRDHLATLTADLP